MKKKSFNLRIPGPTPLPVEVLKAASFQMINHRGKEYEKIQLRIINNLKYFFQTKNEIFLLTSSGMGGLETSIVNFFSPGDKLIFFTCGEFGNRYSEIARRFGGNVVQVKFPVGISVGKDEVKRILSENDDAKGVFFTHNETSTGVLNKIAGFAPFIKSHKNRPLFLVDSISALGAIDLPMDKTGIDVLVTASQKAWMAPPGISMIAVSDKAWKRHKNAKMPRYYFDLTLFREFALKNQTPATPAVGVLRGLDQSLEMMRKEGREKIFEKHKKLKEFLRNGLRKLGLKLYVEESDASLTVTSFELPDGLDNHEFLAKLREKYNIVLAGGMGETKGKIIRIAHMGFCSTVDLKNVLDAIGKIINSSL